VVNAKGNLGVFYSKSRRAGACIYGPTRHSFPLGPITSAGAKT